MKIVFLLIVASLWMPLAGNSQIFNQNPPASQTGAAPPFAQTDPSPLPTTTDTPIDSGVVFLLIVGLALGVKNLKGQRNKQLSVLKK